MHSKKLYTILNIVNDSGIGRNTAQKGDVMALAKCPRCGKLFNKLPNPQYSVCKECEEAEKNDFEQIIELLQKEGNLNAFQISEILNISIDVVLRMIEQGLIEKSDENNSTYCGRCGKPAISRTKRLCESCLIDLQRECAKAMQELRQSMIEKAKRNELDVPEKVASKKLTPKEKRSKLYEKKSSATSSTGKSTTSKRMVYQEKIAQPQKSKKTNE